MTAEDRMEDGAGRPAETAGESPRDNAGENTAESAGESAGETADNITDADSEKAASDIENNGNTDNAGSSVKEPDGNIEKKSGSGTRRKGGRKGKKAPPVRKRRKRTLGQRTAALFIKIGVIAAVIWILVTVVGGVFICHTSDMFPALRDGDLIITFKLGEYHSGDVVAYEYQDKIFYGRIMGEPGDEIRLDEEGTFTVNGLTPYETIYYTTALRESDSMEFPYTVREGEYFVLTDAREQGIDSRNFGPVTNMKGRVVLQIRRRGF